VPSLMTRQSNEIESILAGCLLLAYRKQAVAFIINSLTLLA